MIGVVLVEPETSGNVGAITRAMANFDISDLYLINPKCDHLEPECRNRAKHSQDILENAIVGGFELLDEFDYVIGTTAKLGTDYNLLRTPIFARQIGELVDFSKKVALVIGRESSGLLNVELDKCDFIVSIPASSKYPTMNISHACTILFYEIFTALNGSTRGDFKAIEKVDKDSLIGNLNLILDELDFNTAEKKETQRVFWRRFISKAQLTKRESQSLHGFFKQILNKLK